MRNTMKNENNKFHSFIVWDGLFSIQRVIPQSRLEEEVDLPVGVKKLLTANPLPKSLLSKGQALRQHTKDYFDRKGVMTSKGVIFSPNDLDEVEDFLLTKVDEWDEYFCQVDKDFDKYVEIHLKSLEEDPNLSGLPNPDKFISLVKEFTPEKDKILEKIKFDFQGIQLDEMRSANRGGDSLADSATKDLVKQIHKTVEDLHKQFEEGRESATMAQVDKAIRVARKVESFAFISVQFRVIGQGLLQFLTKLRIGEALKDERFAQFREAVRYLSNRENIEASIKNSTPILPDWIVNMNQVELPLPAKAEKKAQAQAKAKKQQEIADLLSKPQVELVSEEQSEKPVITSETPEVKAKEVGQETLSELKEMMQETVEESINELQTLETDTTIDQSIPDFPEEDLNQDIYGDDDLSDLHSLLD